MEPTPTPIFTEDEKRELHTIINQIRAARIKLNSVATATGIHYQSFINKVKDLELRQRGEESQYRNNFTRKDYEAIKSWWVDFKQTMFA